MSTSMYETRNDLPEGIRSQLVDLLNARLADAIDLRTQVKVAHWNVKGPEFIALHKLFDEVASDADDYVDLVAERAVQLGGVAEGTARQVAARSALDEYGGNGDAENHVRSVADALADFGRSARRAIGTASDAGDQDTADIFTEISRGVDKWLWFVEAHVQGGAWAHAPRDAAEAHAAEH
jgi:starvation-inducible DNA-binding protein